MKRKGRPEKISPSALSVLRELALELPLATLDELVKAFQTRTGLQVYRFTGLQCNFTQSLDGGWHYSSQATGASTGDR